MRHEFEFPLEDKTELETPCDCVVCGSESPDSEVKIKTGWLDRGNPSEDIFHRHSLTFRCCTGCRWKALFSRVLAGLATIAGTLVSLALIGLAIQFVPNALDSNWVSVPLILVCVAGGVLATKMIYSPIVVLHQLRETMYVSFRDERFANRFEELNRTHIQRV